MVADENGRTWQLKTINLCSIYGKFFMGHIWHFLNFALCAHIRLGIYCVFSHLPYMAVVNWACMAHENNELMAHIWPLLHGPYMVFHSHAR